MVIVWRLRRNIIRTALCWVVYTMFTVSSTLIWAVLTGPADWICHIGTLTLCVEVVALSCIIVTWWSGPGGIQALSERPTGVLQCFDTVGLVIWPVKIVPDMTYNVLSGTLNTQSINQIITFWGRRLKSFWWKNRVTPSVPHRVTPTLVTPLDTRATWVEYWGQISYFFDYMKLGAGCKSEISSLSR